MDKVSIIIPTWNRANTIKQAIDSALKQTLSPQEILICDDGSVDNTEEVVKSIDDPRIYWFPGTRGGRPAIPRNRGIQVSKGEWLAFLDSDDEWLPNKLEKELALAKKLNCLAVCCNAKCYIPGKGIRDNLLSWNSESLTYYDLLKSNQVVCSSSLIHRSLLKTIIGFPEESGLKALEDYALWLRIATQTIWGYIDEPLVIYREDAANSARKDDSDVWTQRKVVLKNFLIWVDSQKNIVSLSEDMVMAAQKEYFDVFWRKYYERLKNFVKTF
jgi:teichuronic acid biosynthesis glycosyltransferase TuaG